MLVLAEIEAIGQEYSLQFEGNVRGHLHMNSDLSDSVSQMFWKV